MEGNVIGIYVTNCKFVTLSRFFSYLIAEPWRISMLRRLPDLANFNLGGDPCAPNTGKFIFIDRAAADQLYGRQ